MKIKIKRPFDKYTAAALAVLFVIIVDFINGVFDIIRGNDFSMCAFSLRASCNWFYIKAGVVVVSFFLLALAGELIGKPRR